MNSVRSDLHPGAKPTRYFSVFLLRVGKPSKSRARSLASLSGPLVLANFAFVELAGFGPNRPEICDFWPRDPKSCRAGLRHKCALGTLLLLVKRSNLLILSYWFFAFARIASLLSSWHTFSLLSNVPASVCAALRTPHSPIVAFHATLSRARSRGRRAALAGYRCSLSTPTRCSGSLAASQATTPPFASRLSLSQAASQPLCDASRPRPAAAGRSALCAAHILDGAARLRSTLRVDKHFVCFANSVFEAVFLISSF